MPKGLKFKGPGQSLKKGESQYFTCPPVLTGCWVDKNFICFTSNKHDTFELTEAERRTHDDQPIIKPAPILDYNKYMGGVDLADQMIKHYHIKRRSIKWYKKLFFHLLNMAVHTAHVIYKHHKQCDIRALKFRHSLVDQLLLSTGPDPSCRVVSGRPRSVGTDLAKLYTTNHYAADNPTNAQGKPKFRTCRVCNAERTKRMAATNRKRVETRYCCAQCGDIPLCLAPCFKKWHRQLDLTVILL